MSLTIIIYFFKKFVEIFIIKCFLSDGIDVIYKLNEVERFSSFN